MAERRSAHIASGARPITRSIDLASVFLGGLSALYGIGGVAALLLRDLTAIQMFFAGSAIFAVLATGSWLVQVPRAIRTEKNGLALLCVFYLIGPLGLAPPFLVLGTQIDLTTAYFEAASALTTTGGSAIRRIDQLTPTLLVWRSLVAGAGGFFFIVTALAIMAPLSIGGFEVSRGSPSLGQQDERENLHIASIRRREALGQRVVRLSRVIILPYTAFVLFVVLGLCALGASAFEAICLALSVSSTTGFSPVALGITSAPTILMEAFLAVAMILPAIGIVTHLSAARTGARAYISDPEIKYLLGVIMAVVALMFLWHWSGAIELSAGGEINAGLQAFWGSVFMAVSFATTTGFQSVHWGAASEWSGLGAPALLLLALALIGGGAASTAGGLKLNRAALLAKHSLAELSRLAYPSSVQPIRSGSRNVGLASLRIVFVFMMLYLLSLAAFALMLCATGADLVSALAASIASVGNVGPIFPLVAENPNAFADLPQTGKLISCAAMVVGRLETLAVVAMLSPSAWRR